MCGIFAILCSKVEEEALRDLAVSGAAAVRHRGPDWSGVLTHAFPKSGVKCALAHERLAINGLVSGEQPMQRGTAVLSINGEIFNHREAEASLGGADILGLKTGSDCEVILPLFELKDELSAVRSIDGQFAFVISDYGREVCYAARDPIGIDPLYYGHGFDGSIFFSSELKALEGKVSDLRPFPPGHLWKWENGKETIVRFYTPEWTQPNYLPSGGVEDEQQVLRKVRETVIEAVRRQLMSEVPYGVLLSGGLDSSLVSAIAARMHKENGTRWFKEIHSFSIGMEGSPDLAAAAEVAKFIGSRHHAWTFTAQQGIDALKSVIRHIETYDVTTIRASTPMFLLSRRIKATGVKMVLSGEGADEIFGGYLYFHKAPNGEEFQAETVRKVLALHQYDCLRANKSTLAWGVEARVPYLDSLVLDLVMNLDPKLKMVRARTQGGRPVEKWLLRAAFDVPEDPYLPEHLLWRQKEQFSDGVGYNWIDSLKAFAEKQVSDHEFENAKYRFPINTPRTKEAFLYRSYFESFFPSAQSALTVPHDKSVACSSEVALRWDKEWEKLADPSGRAVAGVHIDAYQKK